jgi:diacylglycerol kinase (ATP)
MSSKRIRVLVNPAASAGRAQLALRRLRTQPACDLCLEWTDCASAAELHDCVRRAQAEALDALALAGGDGTVALALNALEALNPVPLGILPTGVGNDFARDLGVPGAAADALHLLDIGQARRVDVARACWLDGGESRRYACTASVGLDELALRELRCSRWPRSRALHIYAALRAAWNYRPRRLRVTWRDGSFEGEVQFAAVTNTRGYAGCFVVSPEARLNDGMLDLCLIQRTSRLRLLSQFPRLMQGTHGSLPEVVLAQSPWVRIEGVGEELPIALDGELAQATTPVELHSEPAAARFVMPQVEAEPAALELVPRALPAFGPSA